MLFHWLYPLSADHSFLNVFRYITTRSFISFVLATTISIFWGKRFIAFMKMKQFGQVIRDVGPEEHKKKAGTPTFGGAFIIGTIFITILITGNFNSKSLWLTLGVCVPFFILGYVDDYLKILKKNSDGVSAKMKLLVQTVVGVGITYLAQKLGVIDGSLYMPFFKGPVLDLGMWYPIFGALVIVGSSNAVNLTDGLDGLAIGPILTSSATFGVLAYAAGHVEISNYLYIPYIEGSGELTVVASALIGAGVGFLWYNTYPAQVFMGDVGSLSLGGVLGVWAVLTKNELLFVLIGGIFVIETLSVIIQVGSYRLRKKRVFKMAPIHHHFELKGWPEPKVIVRFWIVSLVFAILAVGTLKLR